MIASLSSLVILSLAKASWPDGRYCLPMPSNRICPSGWSYGYWTHDVEDSDANRFCNVRRYGWVPYNSNYCHDLRWGFCCKTRAKYPPTGKRWPKGAYCIFRYGGWCPKGFATGYHYWDDEDTRNRNSRSGVLPDGVYNHDTKIYFCCRNDPVPQSCNRINPLSGLPICSELILMRYKGKCHPPQPGYLGPHTGYLQWDTEDDNNRDGHFGVFPDDSKSNGDRVFGNGIIIQFCSYTSYHRC